MYGEKQRYSILQYFLTFERRVDINMNEEQKADLLLHIWLRLDETRSMLSAIEKGLDGEAELDTSEVHGIISIIKTADKAERYAMLITDFSSFAFDFLYLGRKVFSFIPDEMQFNIEHGRSVPSIDVLMQIADVLHSAPNEFLLGAAFTENGAQLEMDDALFADIRRLPEEKRVIARNFIGWLGEQG